ncbi:MAG: peroxiredoxin family protein [Flavobacteriales bacterium]
MSNEFEIGNKLPKWKIAPIIEGESIPEVSDYIGRPFIIVFFSLNCPGCLGRAIPFANRIVFENEEYINVIGIHTHFEGPETTTKRLLDAKEEFFIRFPYYKDTGFAATFHSFKAGGTPHWIVVDEQGIIKESVFGSDPNRALLKLDYLIEELKTQ